MLLSALKILIFFAIVLAVTLGVLQLSETGDGLTLVYGGTEYTLGPVQTLIAVTVTVLLGWLAVRLLGLLLAFVRFLLGDETAVSRYFARSRERKGYEALSEGMLAVASGEGRLAQDKAARAARFLDKPHVTDLLAAQAAEVAGDRAKAGEVYRRLLSDDRTRFVGIRGLLRQKLDEGDTATALKLAEKAYALQPKSAELQDTLLELQTRQGDWKGARAVLKDKRKQGQLPQDVHIRRDAVLALKEASEVLAEGNSISAREAAISASRASPDLIPAAVLAARSYIAQNDGRNAARVLHRVWAPRQGHFIAPLLMKVNGINDLDREVFGPVLHVATFRADQLDRVVQGINARGYGLTFGLHTRIDSRVQEVSEAIHAGNIYVNRNQIGAVVGSQPFGGEGLSGTGPKAGGPLYLARFFAPDPVDPGTDWPGHADGRKLQAALAGTATLGEAPITEYLMSGPTGELNRLSLLSRPALLCLGPGVAAVQAQVASVQALGGRAVAVDGTLSPAALAATGDISGAIWWGDAAQGRAYAQALAGRKGAIVPLITTRPDLAHVAHERHLCVDTTAAGGNAALLAG